MPHIIILDENGNEIGREEHNENNLAAETEDHKPTVIRMDLGRVAELLKDAKNEKA